MSFDFDAGRYAAFIWPAYAVTAAGFAWMVADTLLRARRWRAEAERLEADRLKADRLKAEPPAPAASDET